MKNSAIEWCEHTFNPWEGCTKVSPGCTHCYAEARNARFGGGVAVNWGKGAPRRRTSASNWAQPLKWDREAAIHGLRPRVFCASLADWLDDEIPVAWLADLLDLIRRTPNLDWLLLTKRPENWNDRLVAVMVREDENAKARGDRYRSDLAIFIGKWIEGIAPHRGLAEIPANVWIGTTVEDQQRADERTPALLKIPARVRFLSCEPLLERVNLAIKHFGNPLTGEWIGDDRPEPAHVLPRINWVIVGGESGKDARPMHPDWARSLRDQCAAAGVPFFFKQWGGHFPVGEVRNRPCRVNYIEIDGQRISASCYHDHGDGVVSLKIGKKGAGRLLDGVEHNGAPADEEPQP